MEMKIPSNVIIKSIYQHTFNLLKPNYFHLIQEKIISYIKENEKNSDFLEIEAKFGMFEFRGSAVKELSKIEETFLIPENIPKQGESYYQFNAGLTPDKFYLIWNAVEKESKLKGANIDFLGTFTSKDIMYNTNKRKSILIHDGKEIKEETIRKEDKKQINVRNYGNDFRITCCKEMPTDIVENDKEESVREKFRVSYQLSFFRVDFTISKDSRNNYAYEIEIELNQLKVELKKKPINYDTVFLILDRFIQNIHNLYSVLIPRATYEFYIASERSSYENRENKHFRPDEINNIWGNYFKNNLINK